MCGQSTGVAGAGRLQVDHREPLLQSRGTQVVPGDTGSAGVCYAYRPGAVDVVAQSDAADVKGMQAFREREFAVVAVVQGDFGGDLGAGQPDLALSGRVAQGAEEAGGPACGEELFRVGGVAGSTQLLRDGEPVHEQSVGGAGGAAVAAF